MLNKTNRLKKRKEFNFIYKKGEVIYSKNFNLHVVRAYKHFAQIGIVVSKQVGNSVVRSRVKRIFSEACRLNINKFAVKNYVITAKEGSALLKSNELEKELLNVLKENNLLVAENV
ncbi:MAG: ribonuclease P protein component [Clostridia bacterium]|nr:ribonuclease P protein component [Clostridia bacterium]